MFKSQSLQVTNINDEKRYGFGKILHAFAFQDSSLFILDTLNMPDELVAPILTLFAGISRHGKGRKKYADYDTDLHDAIPSSFIEIASRSRVSSGCCLLK